MNSHIEEGNVCNSYTMHSNGAMLYLFCSLEMFLSDMRQKMFSGR